MVHISLKSQRGIDDMGRIKIPPTLPEIFQMLLSLDNFWEEVALCW